MKIVKSFFVEPKGTNTSYMASPGISDLVKQPNVIETLVCEYFGEFLSEVRNHSRYRRLVLCRQTIMFLMRRHTHLSLKDIGRRFHRDHTTVIHSLLAVNNLIDTDEIFRNQINFLESKLQ